MRIPHCATLSCVAVLAFAGLASAADDPYSSLLAPSGTCGPADARLNLDAATAQAVMTCLTNYARTQSGLRPLRPTSPLNAAGDAKLAADVSCGDFSHTPCGKPFESVFAAYLRGATSYRLGENIALGTGSFGTPRQTMNLWLHSAGHRQNILMSAFTDVGIGYLPNQTFQGDTGVALWSQEFGTRSPTEASAHPAVTPAPAKAAVHRKRTARKHVVHLRRA
jgi:uncharacterized protein YkwD